MRLLRTRGPHRGPLTSAVRGNDLDRDGGDVCRHVFSAYEWQHVRFSQSRVFIAVTMGGTMELVMLAWMLNMYRNRKYNIAVVQISDARGSRCATRADRKSTRLN